MKPAITMLGKVARLFSTLSLLFLSGCNQDGSSGKISVNSSPAEAEIYLNGVRAGETPKEFSGLPADEYTVELRKAGYARRYESVVLLDGREVIIDAELAPERGLLLVKSDPSGSEVIIDSQLRGTTPALVTNLKLDTYDVVIRAAGLPDVKKQVELADRKPVELMVQHAPRVAINSYPPGAEILVDGELKGLAPMVLENIPMGAHKILAQLDQHDSQEQSVELVAGLNDTVEFNLTKNSGTLVLDTEPAQVQVFVNGELFATTQPKEGADSISQPLRIALKAGQDHRIQLVRDGYMASAWNVRTEIDQVVTKHLILKRIFVYDTEITTKDEVIKCRLEYKLPNGNIYYERFPGVYNTALADDILDVKAVSLNDESNRDARRLLEQSRGDMP